MKSFSCYFVTLGGSLISQQTKKQNRYSSAETEYIAMATVTSDLIRIKSNLASMRVLCSYFMIIRRNYIILRIRCCIRTPKILRLTVTLLGSDLFLEMLIHVIFLPKIKWQISSRRLLASNNFYTQGPSWASSIHKLQLEGK